jgi:hypothetical protein
MTEEETNKFLHSVIEPDGEWIETPIRCEIETYDDYYDGWICECGQIGSWIDIDGVHFKPIKNPDYFTEKGFFILWRGMQKKYPDKWKAFLDFYLSEELINFETFPEQLALWIKENEK